MPRRLQLTVVSSVWYIVRQCGGSWMPRACAGGRQAASTPAGRFLDWFWLFAASRRIGYGRMLATLARRFDFVPFLLAP
jgi:hypothetical protein